MHVVSKQPKNAEMEKVKLMKCFLTKHGGFCFHNSNQIKLVWWLIIFHL